MGVNAMKAASEGRKKCGTGDRDRVHEFMAGGCASLLFGSLLCMLTPPRLSRFPPPPGLETGGRARALSLAPRLLSPGLHKKARGCPLVGLRATPSLEAQRQRLVATGWGGRPAPPAGGGEPSPESSPESSLPSGSGRAEAVDMAWAYSALLDPADVRRAERLEPLDELEEWHLFMQHYMLALGVREAEGREGLLLACRSLAILQSGGAFVGGAG